MPDNATSPVITCCSQDPVTNALQGITVYGIDYFYCCRKGAFFLLLLNPSEDALCITVTKILGISKEKSEITTGQRLF